MPQIMLVMYNFSFALYIVLEIMINSVTFNEHITCGCYVFYGS